jgi:hypothetical protein
MRHNDPDELSAEVSRIVHRKGGRAGLVDDIRVPVDAGGGDAFGPDDEDEHDVVDPPVDAVQ